MACFLLAPARMLKGLRSSLCFTSASLALLLLANSATAIQRATPQSIRLTSGATHVHPTGRSWGRFFAFASPVDLTTGDGSGIPQAYVFSVVDYACQKGRPELQDPAENPVTCPTPPHPYLVRVTDGTAEDQISNPSVNNTGKIVAFEAMGSFSSECAKKPGASDHRQIFIKNLQSGELKAVTCEPDGNSYAPSLNDAGGALTFISEARLTGNTTGTPQIWVYQYQSPDPTKVGQLTGVTSGQFALGQAPSAAPMLNKLGTHVVFESQADLLGTGGNTGIWQIFMFDRQVGQIFQLTRGNGDSHNPYVEEKRPGSVFFDSVATDLKGVTEPFNGRQIYRADFSNELDLPLIEQWTFGPGNAWMPAVEPNGGKLLFLSDGDLLLNGTTGARLFAIDFRTSVNVLYQITGRGSITGRIGANLGAWFASFVSNDDVGGYGICGRQIWIVTYDPEHYTEAGHARLAATQFGQVPGEPQPGNPNEGCADGNPCSTDTCLQGQVCTHGVKPNGTACGNGDQCNGGVATCQQGKCDLAVPLDCDDQNECTDDTCDPENGCGHADIVCNDNNPCTDDTCSPATGCTFAPKPSMDGLACQNDQVKPTGSKLVLRKLSRAQRLVTRALNKRPRVAKRKLTVAQRLFQDVVPDIGSDPQIPPLVASDLIQHIYGLLGQIAEVLKELKTQTAGGSQ